MSSSNESSVLLNKPSISGSLISSRQNLFDANLRRGETFLTFGEKSSRYKVWVVGSFDPVTNRSNTLAHLAFRRRAAVVTVEGGKVMIIGGKVDGQDSKSVEVFSCRGRLFRPVASLNVARRCVGACAVGDAVLVCGGYHRRDLKSCELYFEGRWQLLAEMVEARVGPAVVLTSDKRVFAIGGVHYGNDFLFSVELCRLPMDLASSPSPPSVNFWRNSAPLREARYFPAAVFFQGSIIVAGGKNKNGFLSSVEMLPTANERTQWISLPFSMNERRYDFSLVFSTQEIFAIGNKIPCNSVERMKVNRKRNAFQVADLTSDTLVEQVSSARWEPLPPINSMARVHRTVRISNTQL